MNQRSKRWCITVNNPPADWEAKMKTLTGLTYCVVGVESAPTTGTPHLQGYMEMDKRKQLSTMKKALEKIGMGQPHLEVAKGTWEQNKTYCSKDGNTKEWGEPCPSTQGSRTDLTEYTKAVLEGKTFLELAHLHPGANARYWNYANKIRTASRLEKEVKRRRTIMEATEMKEWQKYVVEKLDQQTQRQILWVWDKDGGTGKTWLALYLQAKRSAWVTRGGKYADLALAYNYEDTVVFDLARETQERVPYGVLEGFKDGNLFCGKYESMNKIFEPPRVIVFANFPPEKEKLSADRWVVVNIITNGDFNQE